ncbi:glycosyltransferase family 4 protein [Natronoglycomyces albus]|uniref:Glycosyltransferase family 1 protein n=1 Tax=Natronoglycomyces albus TaxID=2811108 RepID=A0A895XM97_9ACTN|nr:glycosyltransferase family 1 protein [Natronoglycomyces albus]QSB06791.1 glycosyltransferase family 1 protein [Natronoglycomyces albus]
MKVALITESFPPHIDGVAGSVLRSAEHLHATGHQPHIIAPAPPRSHHRDHYPWPVNYVPSIPIPSYRSFRAGLPTATLTDTLNHIRPDIIHLASPIGYTTTATTWATKTHTPTVAIWQTDLPSYTEAYHLKSAANLLWKHLRRIHNRANLTLAPSHNARTRLETNGINNVKIWPRGVNLTQFHPRHHNQTLKDALCPNGELLVGYIGRLAREKELPTLKPLTELPGIRLVIAGTGPQRRRLERTLPRALFLGKLTGNHLSALYATLDLFIHTGPHETFGQTLQEAHASATPVATVNAGGAAELVTHHRDGILLPTNNPGTIARTIGQLQPQRHTLATWGQAGRAKVEHRSWHAIGNQLITHYQHAQGHHRENQPDPTGA